MKILRSSEYHRMPWKNGGGETSEIAAFPEGSSVADFGWRLSMAVVASDGPFSIFPRIDRTLAILEGDGLWLTLGEQQAVFLDQASQPLSFPADMPTSAALAGRAVTDLNVMTRRGAYNHRVQRLDCHEPLRFELFTGVNAIFCAAGILELRSGKDTARLAPKDCAFITKSNAGPCLLQGTAKAYLIEINSVI
jgi:uncharacterized protein